MTDPSGVIAGDVEDANTKTPFSAQETVLKALHREGERERGRGKAGAESGGASRHRHCRCRVGDVASSTESVSDTAGPAGFRSGAAVARTGQDSQRNCV